MIYGTSYRPKRIQVWLVDNYTGAEAMIYDYPYQPVKDGLFGESRKFVVKLVDSYRKEKWLYYHNPDKFPSTQRVKLVFIK